MEIMDAALEHVLERLDDRALLLAAMVSKRWGAAVSGLQRFKLWKSKSITECLAQHLANEVATHVIWMTHSAKAKTLVGFLDHINCAPNTAGLSYGSGSTAKQLHSHSHLTMYVAVYLLRCLASAVKCKPVIRLQISQNENSKTFQLVLGVNDEVCPEEVKKIVGQLTHLEALMARSDMQLKFECRPETPTENGEVQLISVHAEQARTPFQKHTMLVHQHSIAAPKCRPKWQMHLQTLPIDNVALFAEVLCMVECLSFGSGAARDNYVATASDSAKITNMSISLELDIAANSDKHHKAKESDMVTIAEAISGRDGKLTNSYGRWVSSSSVGVPQIGAYVDCRLLWMVYKPLRRKRSVGASKESEAPATPASKSSRLVVISDASFFLHERGAAESLVPKAITNLRPRLLREYGVQLDAEPRRAAAADHLTYEFGSSTAAPGILLVCLQGFAHCGPDSWGSDAVVKAIEQAVERALRAMPTKPDTDTGGAATECPTEQDCPFVDRHQRAWRMHAPSVGRSLATHAAPFAPAHTAGKSSMSRKNDQTPTSSRSTDKYP